VGASDAAEGIGGKNGRGDRVVIRGELNGVEGTKCDCGQKLELKVCSTPAGYYLGYECEQCGPWSRETDYFRTRAEAELALAAEGEGHLR